MGGSIAKMGARFLFDQAANSGHAFPGSDSSERANKTRSQLAGRSFTFVTTEDPVCLKSVYSFSINLFVFGCK